MAKRWTARRQAMVESWVSEVKGLMALADWTIHYDWAGNEHTHPSHGEATAFATITPFPSSKHARLALSPELLEQSSKDVTQTLVHELVHCHLFALSEYSLESVALMGKKNGLARKLYTQGFYQQIEITTDAIADAFAPLVPALNLA